MSEAPSGQSKRASLLGLAGDVSVYGAGMIASRFLGVLITPVLTRLFSPADYGRLDILQSSLAIAIALCSLYLESAVMRHYHQHEEGQRPALLFTHLVSVAAVALVAIGLTLPLAAEAARLLLGSAAQAHVIRISVWTILSSLLYQHVITVLRAMRRARLAVSCSLLVAGAQFGLVLLLVPGWGLGLEGVLGARALAEGAGSVVVILGLRAHYQARYSFALLRGLLRFSFPLLPEIVTGVVIGYAARFFLLAHQGADCLGLFSVAQKLALAVTLASGAFKSAWLPYAYSVAAHEEARQLYSYVFSAYLKVMGLCLALLVLFAPELIRVLAPAEYGAATAAVGLLALAAALQGLVYILNVGILISGRTEYYLAASLAAALAALALSAAAIPAWGLMGAALVQVAAQLVMVAVVHRAAGRLYQVDYRVGHLHAFLGAGLALSLLGARPELAGALAARLALAAAVGAAGCWLLRKELGVLRELALARLGVAS